ncbi:unnamed protein product [Heligmosomoides polygyrus]|uniref:Sushi domain-containing protein n=1 Tax=Heligmosomoides polygyrus TaxID=6339 RepID=A0A183FL41_HELPZ|nr:unnamed protein product [Heligmosomoides polygyrus]
MLQLLFVLKEVVTALFNVSDCDPPSIKGVRHLRFDKEPVNGKYPLHTTAEAGLCGYGFRLRDGLSFAICVDGQWTEFGRCPYDCRLSDLLKMNFTDPEPFPNRGDVSDSREHATQARAFCTRGEGPTARRVPHYFNCEDGTWSDYDRHNRC